VEKHGGREETEWEGIKRKGKKRKRRDGRG